MQPHLYPIVTATLAISCCTSASHAQCRPHPDAVQWSIASGGNGHWYARINEPMDWQAAKVRAEQLGGHLATLTSQAENNFVMPLCQPGEGLSSWLGGRRVGDAWTWVTGEKWSFTNWAPGEPNNTNGVEFYLISWVDGVTWNDGGLNYPGTFIVEWDSGLPNDCDGNGVCDDVQVATNPGDDLNSDGTLDSCQCLPHPNARQWRVEDGGNGNWYARIGTVVLWPEARLAAEQLGGHLATPTTAAENAFVATVAIDGYFNVQHLGAQRDGSGWRWITGEPWSYTNWYPGEPNNATGDEIYLATWITPGTWNDIYPEYAAGFIVEWELADLDCDGNGECDAAEISAAPGLDLNRDAKLDRCQCIADVVADGVVNGVDLASVINDWGLADSPADIDRNGSVGGSDLAIVLSAWGPCAP
jgi:hypothetical protein